MLELQVLLVFMIIGAIVAVEVEDLLSSVVAVGTVGLGLSLAFLVLKAPDLAIVQLVVEIMCLIILIRATIGRDIGKPEENGKILQKTVGFGFFVLFVIYSFRVLKNLPEFGKPIMRVSQEYIEKGLGSTGAPNLVSSIILDFRAYDTLGEITVLFAAIIGALAVLRKTGLKKPGEKVEENE